MELYQSYISAITRASLTMYEQRILLKMIEHGQSKLMGLPLSREHGILEHNFNLVELTISIREILNGNKHYEHIRDAVKRLSQREFEVYDDKNGWHYATWILRTDANLRTGNVTLLIDKPFFDTLFNFAKGFVHYDLERALSLKHPQSVRMYALINNQTKPLKYSITNLKKLFGVSDKYERTNDFIRKIIKPAYDELKKGASGNYFEYSTIKTGNKITHLLITRKVRATDTERQSNIGEIHKWLPEDFEKMLIRHVGFTYRQVAHYKELLRQLANMPTGLQILLDIVERARKKRVGKGWIINALRDEVRGKKQ